MPHPGACRRTSSLGGVMAPAIGGRRTSPVESLDQYLRLNKTPERRVKELARLAWASIEAEKPAKPFE